MRQQKRTRCQDCRREWIYRTQGPEGNCPVCGSNRLEQVVFFGLFDIDTPPQNSMLQPELPAPTLAAEDARIVAQPLVLVKA